MIKKHIAIICCSIGVTFVALTIPSILIYSKNIGTAHLIAHRGYSSKYYENTKTAFEEAGKSDAFWGIETDLFKTKDGEFVCSHNVDPFGKSKPRIIDLTYEELSEYSIDYSQNYYHLAPPPGEEKGLASFEEYLNICNTYKKVPIIELKQESFFKEDIYSILDKVGNIWNGAEHAWVISFNLPLLEFVDEYYADPIIPKSKRCGVQFLDAYDRSTANDFVNGLLYPFDHVADLALSCWYPIFSVWDAKDLHKKDNKIGIFFLNDAIPGDDNIITVENYNHAGVDFITTDHAYTLF